MFNRLHHTAIICSDHPRLKHFHIEILGFEIIREVYRVPLPARRHNRLQSAGHLLGPDCFDTPGSYFRVFAGHMRPGERSSLTDSGPGHPKVLYTVV
jgi:catechol 2,3-dioxygenase-like lactoylglutathione lyase family enzyme